MKKIIIGMIAVLMLTIYVQADTYEPTNPNYMGFYMADNHVTVFDTFYVDAWVDVNSIIDTAAIENMTFDANLVHYEPNTVQGDLFGGSIIWIIPESAGEINNVTGYAHPITWGHTTPVNNTNGTLAVIEFSAVNCGIVTLSIIDGGTARSGIDPGTTWVNYDIYIHPEKPSNFSVISTNETNNHISWTKEEGADRTLVRYRADTYPTTITDGSEVYNDTGTDCDHSDGQGYYSAWSWNETYGFYSLDYVFDTTAFPPYIENPIPENNSIDVIYPFYWTVDISQARGDPINWTIECSNGQSSSDTNDANGTKFVYLSTLTKDTQYTVWVNASSNGLWTRKWFVFNTSSNLPPAISNPSPHENDYIDVYDIYLNVTVTDPEADTMSVSFYWGNDTLIGTASGIANNTVASLYLPDYIDPDWLVHDTNYTWYAIANDTNHETESDNFWFVTCKAWDINVDRIINYLDVSSVVSHYLDSVSPPGSLWWDVVNNGQVNYLDVSAVVGHYLESY